MKIILVIFIVLLLVYTLVGLFGLIFGEKIAFPAPKSGYTKDSLQGLFFIDNIAALHLDTKSKYTIIYSHGNGEDLSEIYPLLNLYAENGFNVLAYDYSGYGLSKGVASEKNVYKNADVIYNYAVNILKIEPKNIIIAGFSMGSAPTSYLAMKHSKELAGIIIMGGYASGFRTVLPIKLYPFDLLENIKKVPLIDDNCKVLIMHGTKDRIIPYRNAVLMNKKSGGKITFITIKGAGHLDLFKYDSDKFWNAIKSFKETL